MHARRFAFRCQMTVSSTGQRKLDIKKRPVSKDASGSFFNDIQVLCNYRDLERQIKVVYSDNPTYI